MAVGRRGILGGAELGRLGRGRWPQGGALAIQDVQLPGRIHFHGVGRGGGSDAPDARAGGFLDFTEVPLDGLDIQCCQQPIFRADARLQELQVGQGALQGDGGVGRGPLRDDLLQSDPGFDGHALGVEMDRDGHVEGGFELGPGLGRVPGLGQVGSGEVDGGEAPPFFDIEQLLEMGVEGEEESGLPVQMAGQLGQHAAEAVLAVGEFEQAFEKQLGAAAV